MPRIRLLTAVAALAFSLAAGAGTAAAAQQQAQGPAKPAARADAGQPARIGKAAKGHKLDHSGRKRVGKASIYARKFVGRKMADGTPMRAHDDNAASKTLPLGTVARVTNLETGQSARVTIQDRGPYVDGRIVDLSPGTADQIGLSLEQGVAPVEVAPITVPQPDGGAKAGDGARPGGAR
jgi:rare lipoprotein A